MIKCFSDLQGVVWLSVPHLTLSTCIQCNVLSRNHAIERFHMMPRAPYWCSKTMKWRPCCVIQTSPVGVELYSYIKTFFCDNKLAQLLTTWVKTLYNLGTWSICVHRGGRGEGWLLIHCTRNRLLGSWLHFAGENEKIVFRFYISRSCHLGFRRCPKKFRRRFEGNKKDVFSTKIQ